MAFSLTGIFVWLIEAQEKGEVFDYTMAMKDDSGPAPWH